MRRSLWGVLTLVMVIFTFLLAGNTAWALKNVCPDCKVVIENVEQTECPACGKVINKCLICGAINPIKNDNCMSCNASLAESRVLRTIDKETREDLRLGESDRAKIEVELGQIKDQAAKDELTEEMAARQIELLTQMGWWSRANLKAIEYGEKFPEGAQKNLVGTCRVKCLRNLGFLAMEENDFELAVEYLKTALTIAPTDKKSTNLLKMSQDELKKD